jgi:hypothetical protein
LEPGAQDSILKKDVGRGNILESEAKVILYIKLRCEFDLELSESTNQRLGYTIFLPNPCF